MTPMSSGSTYEAEFRLAPTPAGLNRRFFVEEWVQARTGGDADVYDPTIDEVRSGSTDTPLPRSGGWCIA